jgi:hypothetical protein
MLLTLTRQFVVEDATIGVLDIDGKFQCFVLEDVERDYKIKAKTAIPTGSYGISICESPRFSDRYEADGLGRRVPLLLNVPNYQGVRIHVGTKATHTEGCLLVGSWRKELGAKLEGSKAAYKALMKILLANDKGLRITVQSNVRKIEDGLRHPPKNLFEGLFGKDANMCRVPEAKTFIWQ